MVTHETPLCNGDLGNRVPGPMRKQLGLIQLPRITPVKSRCVEELGPTLGRPVSTSSLRRCPLQCRQRSGRNPATHSRTRGRRGHALFLVGRLFVRQPAWNRGLGRRNQRLSTFTRCRRIVPFPQSECPGKRRGIPRCRCRYPASGQREWPRVGPHGGPPVERVFRDQRFEFRRREREPRRRLSAQPPQHLNILGRRWHVAREVDWLHVRVLGRAHATAPPDPRVRTASSSLAKSTGCDCAT